MADRPVETEILRKMLHQHSVTKFHPRSINPSIIIPPRWRTFIPNSINESQSQILNFRNLNFYPEFNSRIQDFQNPDPESRKSQKIPSNLRNSQNLYIYEYYIEYYMKSQIMRSKFFSITPK